MTAVTVEQIQEALSGVMDPELKRNLVELGMVRGMHIEGEQVKITLALTTLECPFNDQIVAETKTAVLALDGVQEVQVDLTEMTDEEKKNLDLGGTDQENMAARFNHIRRVVAVMSGKGGVGKSLVTRGSASASSWWQKAVGTVSVSSDALTPGSAAVSGARGSGRTTWAPSPMARPSAWLM